MKSFDVTALHEQTFISRLQMVPIKEMTDVLKVVKEQIHLKSKAWVRLRRGVYKDDLAQVSYRSTLNQKPGSG